MFKDQVWIKATLHRFCHTCYTFFSSHARERDVAFLLLSFFKSFQHVTSLKCICTDRRLSAKNLYGAFRRDLNSTPWYFLLRLRLLGAMYLMCCASLHRDKIFCKEIAAYVGLSSYNCFRRSFKEFAQIPPDMFFAAPDRFAVYNRLMTEFLQAVHKNRFSGRSCEVCQGLLNEVRSLVLRKPYSLYVPLNRTRDFPLDDP